MDKCRHSKMRPFNPWGPWNWKPWAPLKLWKTLTWDCEVLDFWFPLKKISHPLKSLKSLSTLENLRPSRTRCPLWSLQSLSPPETLKNEALKSFNPERFEKFCRHWGPFWILETWNPWRSPDALVEVSDPEPWNLGKISPVDLETSEKPSKTLN